ncbi:PH domain-containing protein [Candidatus Micrarchaeota archaeon]|nr:PH domain-containing protein [Candidatus Micrarchaeota archaeon]
MPYDLKSDATSNEIRLSRKKILKKTFKANIILIAIFLAVTLVYLSSPAVISQTLSPLGINNEALVMLFLLAVVFLAVVINILYNYLYYRTYYFNVKEDLIVIRKGIFLPDEISIPYNRIQDIYVDRDTLDLIFGLYDVHVSSATVTSEKDAHIDGVTNANAVKLKEMILAKVKEASSHESPL